MIRINVVVEGRTEESFVGRILAPILWSRQIFLTPIILGRRGQKGGRTNYDRVKTHVVTLLKQDPSAYCSTMIDFYGLGKGFPGMPLPPNLANIDKVVRIERAVSEDIVARNADLRPDVRFLPYLQLHEYEALLFSDPQALATAIRQNRLAQQFQAIRRKYPTPEDINDDPNTAASKQVLGAYPAYRKVVDGMLAAQAVGIDKMREECAHFDGWIRQLEALGAK